MGPVGGRVAVYGGDARQVERWGAANVVFYESSKFGGNGELRRIESALRAGTIAEVIILRKWNGHSGTSKVRKLCRRLGVPFRVV
jgi:hypothetical protein